MVWTPLTPPAQQVSYGRHRSVIFFLHNVDIQGDIEMAPAFFN